MFKSNKNSDRRDPIGTQSGPIRELYRALVARQRCAEPWVLRDPESGVWALWLKADGHHICLVDDHGAGDWIEDWSIDELRNEIADFAASLPSPRLEVCQELRR